MQYAFFCLIFKPYSNQQLELFEMEENRLQITSPYPHYNPQYDLVLNFKARTDPKSMIPHLEQALSKFTDQMRYQISPNFFMRTHEGKSVWKETINFLKSQKPLKNFNLHKGLQKSAQLHATDLGKNNMMGHVGSNGSTMRSRIEMYSVFKNSQIGENVAQQIKTQGRNHELEAVLALIVDDGVSDRGHRESIFSPDFNYVGVGFGETNKHYLVVINYSENNLALKEGSEHDQMAPQQKVVVQKKPIKNQLSEFDDLTNLMNLKMNVTSPENSKTQDKKVVSKNTSTKSQTVNGHTITTKIVHLKYSDGSEQKNIEEIHS